MKRTEIPAVKCYGHADKEEGLCSVIWWKDDDYMRAAGLADKVGNK